ncbi:hypothetical protein V2J09_010553 [Rumex salicifolius]
MFTPLFSPVLLFLLLSPAGAAVNSSTEFDFGTLTLTSLKLLGDAHLRDNSVYLTRDLAVPNSGSGRALYARPVRFRRPGVDSPASFSTFFSFSISSLNPSSIGGGLAFIISPDDVSIGGAGGFLGLQSPDSGRANGFVAVEFDTLMDVEFKDINGNHVGLDLNDVVSTRSADLGSIEIDLKSGDLINAWIEFDGPSRSFNVSVSYSNLKPEHPLLSFNLALEKYVNDFMFVGFSGSTQGSTEAHSIEWWSFSSSFVATPPPPTSALIIPASDSSHLAPPAMAPEQGTSINSPSSSKQSRGVVAGAATAGAFCFALFTGALIFVYSKKTKSWKKSESLASDLIKMPKEFSYKELKSATKSFDSSKIIGHGAFGTVYKGILPETGEIVAVKRCSHSTQGKTEFISELSIIGTLRHRNLVRLQGYCHEKGEILLVYDLMPNGSLDKVLFESRTVLPWSHRKNILHGVASALAYLHQECENQVIHRDVKSSNIMLDERFNSRLGDFGLARQIEHDKSPDATIAAGTMGYLAPEYLLTGKATDKTDVFSFGAVILEVCCGRRPIEKKEIGGFSNLVDWVWGLHREGRILDAGDLRLSGEFDREEMRRVLLVGLACSSPDAAARPVMRCVARMLAGEAEPPLVPRDAVPAVSFTTSQLVLSLQDTVSDCNALLTVSSSSSSLEKHLMGGDLV